MTSLAQQIAKDSPLEERLRALDLVRPDERFTGFSERFGWRRGGDESYIAAADIEVVSDNTTIRPVLMKAIVGFGTTKEKVEAMLERRELLESVGVKTSDLYACEDSVFYERFLPETVDPVAYVRNDDPRLSDLITYASALDVLGFAPVARDERFFRDLLADDDGAYVIDFGSDLGTPNPHHPSHHGRDALERIARRATIDHSQRKALDSAYDASADAIRSIIAQYDQC